MANEKIENDREVEPVIEIIAVTNEEIGNDQEVEPAKENTYVPGPRSSKRLRPRVNGGS